LHTLDIYGNFAGILVHSVLLIISYYYGYCFFFSLLLYFTHSSVRLCGCVVCAWVCGPAY